MSSLAPRPYFTTPLYPTLRRVDRNQTPRFLLQTAWEVRRPDRPGVIGEPKDFDSLIVFDDLFISVLPYRFRVEHRIFVSPLDSPTPPWRNVPCDLGETNLWIFHADLMTTLLLRLRVRLPQTAAASEPHYPLIGTQFLRCYEPHLTLDYGRFTWGLAPDLGASVGCMEWL